MWKDFKGSALATVIAVMVTINAGCMPSPQEKTMVAYRQNPAPKQAYRLTMRIDNAPGPFAQMLALAQYDVMNRECLPPPNENGGHLSPVPTEDVPIALTKVSDTEYTGTFHLDRMLDEDYHGRGGCRWKLMQVRVHLKATGAEAETNFIPSLPDEEIMSQGERTIYFLRQSYPRATVDNLPTFGQSDREKLAPGLSDADLFTVILAASRETP